MTKRQIIKGALLGLCFGGIIMILGNYIRGIQGFSDNRFLSSIDWIILYLSSPSILLTGVLSGSIFNELYGKLIHLIFFIYFIVLGIFLTNRIHNRAKNTIFYILALCIFHGIALYIYSK